MAPLRSTQKLRSEPVAGGVHAQIALHVLPQQVFVGMGCYLALRVEDENIPLPIHAFPGVVVFQRSRPSPALIQLRGLLHQRHRIGPRIRFGDAQRRHRLIPPGPEPQPIAPHYPRLLELMIAADRIQVQVVHPPALLRGRQYHIPKPVLGNVHPQIAFQVLSQQLLIGVSCQFILLVDDENIPVPVHALRGVVILQRSRPPIPGIAAEGLLHQGNGIFDGIGFSGGPYRAALIPPGAENQPVMAHQPGMFALLKAGLRIQKNIVHPLPFLIGHSHLLPVRVAGDVHSRGPVHRQPQQLRTRGMGDADVVFVIDENIPGAIDAVRGVVAF